MKLNLQAQLRNAVYRSIELPTEENRKRRAELKEKCVKAYGEKVTAIVVQSAEKVIENQQKRLVRGHLPAVRLSMPY